MLFEPVYQGNLLIKEGDFHRFHWVAVIDQID